MVVVDMLGVVKEVTPDPLVNTEPPLEASYQSIVSPLPGVAEIVTVPLEHLELLPALGSAGVVFGAATPEPALLTQPFTV